MILQFIPSFKSFGLRLLKSLISALSFANCFKNCRHKTRLHIGQLVKDTSTKLKQASEIDHHVEVSVSSILYLVSHMHIQDNSLMVYK